jgi:hypothetical protein
MEKIATKRKNERKTRKRKKHGGVENDERKPDWKGFTSQSQGS